MLVVGCCSLLVVRCSLFVFFVRSLSSVVRCLLLFGVLVCVCLLPIVRSLLLFDRCLLFVACELLFVVCCALFVVRCLLFVVCGSLFVGCYFLVVVCLVRCSCFVGCSMFFCFFCSRGLSLFVCRL